VWYQGRMRPVQTQLLSGMELYREVIL